MEERIIFPNEDGTISVITPVAGDLSVAEVARKDVPAGVPYLFVTVDDLPESRLFRAAWEADFSNPDGHGIGAEAWFKEQAK